MLAAYLFWGHEGEMTDKDPALMEPTVPQKEMDTK